MDLRIYTRTGDTGETSLIGGRRVGKHDPRISVCGDLDELSASMGAALAELPEGHDLRDEVDRVQEDLFGIGAEVAAPGAEAGRMLRDERVAALEASIDAMESGLEKLTGFLLPGGGKAGAALHVSRTVCRRAERSLVGLSSGDDGGVRPAILGYMNRLSDWLFVAARRVNREEGSPERTGSSGNPDGGPG
ncbi:MAG: cob(I)yrinic acid a,c-diamide adenosyltransferase [Gemmatimonadota bacterium]|jgi:cob(I)alamin adenosyltransferase|nr:cob(I)yrinic acid a,c-diamide adenosyltransferase [Gemmatimonadota bacterium]MDP6528728.1 cob(I)yrinic acid a,c-diamide adenosyltransferase [Gemmatimonadota bacterium]MDP6802227.1 cob(I)yrinic acid a,c-diamide adenosyltransferase [Gemmatimonadota bacterium]MDP7032148.1 cob(I)yrinic acid a,c-diamide adenosyltransferase [Gemmatimonadota bacterium]